MGAARGEDTTSEESEETEASASSEDGEWEPSQGWSKVVKKMGFEGELAPVTIGNTDAQEEEKNIKEKIKKHEKKKEKEQLAIGNVPSEPANVAEDDKAKKAKKKGASNSGTSASNKRASNDMAAPEGTPQNDGAASKKDKKDKKIKESAGKAAGAFAAAAAAETPLAIGD